jgi:hypothetical protein
VWSHHKVHAVLGCLTVDDKELKELRLLIESMQSGLVELFDQLSEIRARLDLRPEDYSEATPNVLPLFSEVGASSKSSGSTPLPAEANPEPERVIPQDTVEPQASEETHQEESPDTGSAEPEQVSSVSAKVSRVLDPVAEEIKTGEAGADIVLEFLQTAKDYLIDDDPRKEKVARDMDVVLRFLQARGKRAIREDERENILKRMERWKAHLIAYVSSPAA